MAEANDKIKLSWFQIIWGLSLISTILLTYADIKNRVSDLSKQMNNVYSKSDIDIAIADLRQQDRTLAKQVRVINKKLCIETGDD